MKQLAESGHGLSTFISRHVRNRYEFRRRKEYDFGAARRPVRGVDALADVDQD